MRKYGIDNFVFEVVVQTKFHKEIDGLEVLIIDQYRSTDKNIGYNTSPGGQTNKLVSLETRKKMSMAAMGREVWNKNKPCSEQTKKLLSQSNKGNKFRLGVKTSEQTKLLLSQINTGKKVTDETKRKMSQSMLGKNIGEKNGMFGKSSVHAKLTQEQVSDIRTEYSTNKTAMLKLAHKYNVSKKTIFNIIHGAIYK
jgi:hypothetical protein